MGAASKHWHSVGLPLLLDRRELPTDFVRAAMQDLIAGTFDEAEATALLLALRFKGETASELSAAAAVLRGAMLPLSCPTRPVLDTCGTGGDASGTFNISTVTALVVAASGVPVVKHGNKSVSSRSGSADVLAALGVPIESGPTWAHQTLKTYGIAFCFAPHFHPALARVAPLRRKLGVRTIFNLLGPLLNPAGAEYQLLGVGNIDLLDPMAGALAHLGTRDAILVCGQDGLDEVSLCAPTLVRRVRDGLVEKLEWSAADFGLEPTSITDLKADGPMASVRIIEGVLSGVEGAPRRIILANAAAALLVTGRVPSLTGGVELAAATIDSGAARQLLASLVAPAT
ncbi:MAG TPA: anthranilate phosphoribosyltransferase [Gemmataceae bacterium]|nr:anthranilate phosphoribosyltransferase [Gemmataceae bacterium]